MATTAVARTGSGAWVKVAFAMFAVGWGANQFSPMLIVYRHELRLGADAVAGLFLVYALTLIPGLLVGGPAGFSLGSRRYCSAWPTGCAWCPGSGRLSRWPGRPSAARWSPAITRWPT